LSPYGQGSFSAYGKRWVFHEWVADSEFKEGLMLLDIGYRIPIEGISDHGSGGPGWPGSRLRM